MAAPGRRHLTPNRRLEKVLARRIETLRTALYEKGIEYGLFGTYLEEEPDPDDTDRPPDEVIEREFVAVLEECEILESKLLKAWSALAWLELGVRP